MSALVSAQAELVFEPQMPGEDQRQTPATVPRLFDELFEAPQCLSMQVGLTGGNVRRDAIRVAWSSIFFLLAILPWHFRAKTPCKIKLRTSKTPKNDRFLGKWEKLSLDPPLL